MLAPDISPIFISLGPLSIRYYGLVYALAFLGLYILLLKKRHEFHFSEEECSEFLLTIGISMMVFGRLFHFLIDNPAVLFQNPLEFFMIWHGGIAFFGSFVGLIIGAFAYLYVKKKPILERFLQLSDILTLVGSFSLIFGRIANFINQELVGTPTNVAWCFNFILGRTETGPFFDTVCRHPYQLYASFSHLILFITLYLIMRHVAAQKKSKQQSGLVFSWFIILYGAMRFIVDFWREDTRLLFGFTSWQFIALAMVIAGSVTLFFLKKYHGKQSVQGHKKETKKEAHK